MVLGNSIFFSSRRLLPPSAILARVISAIQQSPVPTPHPVYQKKKKIPNQRAGTDRPPPARREPLRPRPRPPACREPLRDLGRPPTASPCSTLACPTARATCAPPPARRRWPVRPSRAAWPTPPRHRPATCSTPPASSEAQPVRQTLPGHQRGTTPSADATHSVFQRWCLLHSSSHEEAYKVPNRQIQKHPSRFEVVKRERKIPSVVQEREGLLQVFAEINNEQDHPLIEPEGKSWHWTDVKGRTPATVLTLLLKKNHPGMIQYGGKVVVASTWKHYQAATDSARKSAAYVVSEGFWKRFRFNPAKENESRKHVGSSCSQLLYSTMYYARITAIMDHFRKVEKRKICDKIAGKFYLTREEYIAQRPEWLLESCWEVLATEWSSLKFRQRSETNHGNRYSQKFKPHKGGSNSELQQVPSPPAPPPLPLDYVAASSANPSHVNVGTFGSSIGMETPEETLSRIAYGGYRCHVNATSGVGTYSREDDDEFPMLSSVWSF